MLRSVAVAIPCWNGRRWLDGCLASIGAQSRAAEELIVVDNGSTDGSVARVRELRPDAHVIELGRNTGFAYAANTALRQARGDAVALVNQDVRLEPD